MLSVLYPVFFIALTMSWRGIIEDRLLVALAVPYSHKHTTTYEKNTNEDRTLLALNSKRVTKLVACCDKFYTTYRQ